MISSFIYFFLIKIILYPPKMLPLASPHKKKTFPATAKGNPIGPEVSRRLLLW